MLRKLHIYLITGLISFLVLQSCNVKQFIPEGELLYRGADLDIDTVSKIKNFDQLRTQLETVIQPEPNSKFLGMQPGLYFHYKAQKEKPGFINKFLNDKIGQKPVYLSNVNPILTEDLLLNRLENRGFFYSTATSSVKENEAKKTATMLYKVSLTEPYILENYTLDSDTLLVYKEIAKFLPETPLEKGMRFDLPVLKLERDRLDRKLKEIGYYNFNSGFLIFEADTNQYSNKRFDLFLKLKKEVPVKSIIPYKISKVNIYPNYVIGNDTIKQDTVRYEGKSYIQAEEFFKPKHLDPYILIDEGALYSPADSRNTSRRLASIGAYKFVNIRYDQIDTLATDSLGILEANIYLSPLNKRAIRAEIQALTKSNNFAGPNLAVTLSNRNRFGGGETFNISGKFGYEVQIAGGDRKGLSSIQLGAGADLIFPRMLFPISLNDDWFKYSIPKTKISLEAEYLSRSELFSLGSVSSRFGYFWNANRYVSHEFNPVSVNYVRLTKTTPEFETILDQNPFLRNSFDQQFIAGFTYSFTYNEMVDLLKKHQFFLNTTVDVAGNGLDLISGNADEGPQTFFGLEYAQYAKADADFRHHFNFGKEQKIATRLFAGYGIPYGNSRVMPFSKQYFSGGPYSVRAFRIRSLGPGTYDPAQSGDAGFFDQSGNIRFEANTEYRFPIISFLKGAAFLDAGNVWNTNESLPGGKFSSNFLKELGIGGGVGLRVDIQSFVIRFDLAAPFRTPYLPEGERWNFDFGKPVFNFAIGYPF